MNIAHVSGPKCEGLHSKGSPADFKDRVERIGANAKEVYCRGCEPGDTVKFRVCLNEVWWDIVNVTNSHYDLKCLCFACLKADTPSQVTNVHENHLEDIWLRIMARKKNRWFRRP